jgi:hypothetical protein
VNLLAWRDSGEQAQFPVLGTDLARPLVQVFVFCSYLEGLARMGSKTSRLQIVRRRRAILPDLIQANDGATKWPRMRHSRDRASRT